MSSPTDDISIWPDGHRSDQALVSVSTLSSPELIGKEIMMGKLVVTEFMSLDGIIEDPGGAEGTPHGGWSFRFPTPEGQQYKYEELLASDVQLLGRVTYEGFAAAWPQMEEATGEFGKRMNNMPKVVVSTTLTEPEWNNTTVISGNVAAEVARLKEHYQGDVLVSASATLVDTLREHDLVDEYRLMVHPVVLGSGKRLFKKGAAGTGLTLVDCRKVGPDVLLLIYRPASKEGNGVPAS
jgi:dihydrofolate reductase